MECDFPSQTSRHRSISISHLAPQDLRVAQQAFAQEVDVAYRIPPPPSNFQTPAQ
eukprot:m.55278 g.55278  ORF g.55278 m.55278 type:complete len:55 (+) comp48857_c0_seq9:166-330(+)